LENVFDILCGTPIEDPSREEYFYSMNCIIKIGLYHKLLETGSKDEEARKKIFNANKADMLALKETVEQIDNLKVERTIDRGVKEDEDRRSTSPVECL